MKTANFWASQINENDKRSYKFYVDAVEFEKLTGISGMKFREAGNVVCAEVKQAGDMVFTPMEVQHEHNGHDMEMYWMGILSFDPSTVLLSFKGAYNIQGAAPDDKVQVIISKDKFRTKNYEFNENELKDLEYFARKSANKDSEFDEMDYEGALEFLCKIAKKVVNL